MNELLDQDWSKTMGEYCHSQKFFSFHMLDGELCRSYMIVCFLEGFYQNRNWGSDVTWVEHDVRRSSRTLLDAVTRWAATALARTGGRVSYGGRWQAPSRLDLGKSVCVTVSSHRFLLPAPRDSRRWSAISGSPVFKLLKWKWSCYSESMYCNVW